GLLAGLVSAVAGHAVNLFQPAASTQRGGLDPASSGWFWLLAGNLPTLVAFLLFIQGRVLCARAPESSRLRGFALGSVLGTVGALLGWVVLVFGLMLLTADAESNEGMVSLLIGLLGLGLAGLVGEVLFLCHLSR